MKKKRAITPPPRTAAEHLAAQSGTNAADWYPVTTGTQRYREGYRWWNKATDQWAKRVIVLDTKPKRCIECRGTTFETRFDGSFICVSCKRIYPASENNT